MAAPAASPPNEALSSSRSAVQRPSIRKDKHGQTRISCTLCRRKKVRCDRSSPCANCVRVGVECVPSIPSQAPRGRQGGRKRRLDGELLERIAKLETLIENAGNHIDEQGTTPRPMNTAPQCAVRGESSQLAVSDNYDRSKRSSNAATGHRSQNSRTGLDRYMGSSFWITLSEEVNGLREVLNDSSDEEDEVEDGQTPPSRLSSSERQQLQQASNSGPLIFPTTSENPCTPTSHQLYTFCEVYLRNVDKVVKILHAPSLRRHLQDGAATLDCSPGPRGLEALRLAICFAATISMTDEECKHRIGEDRAALIARYRAGTELALTKADFVNTVEMSTLQAMTIYLASVRVHDSRRLMWTLTSLAVRIAQALGLHHESFSSSLGIFEKEMRRRLWWQICVLDSHAAEDRATNPIIYADSFSTRVPLHVNDGDLHVDALVEVEGRQGFTDMTFGLTCHALMDTVRRLNYIPVKELGEVQRNSQINWTQRIDAVIKAQRHVEDKYLCHLNLAHPFHWATRLVADMITAIIWLVVYRPLQQRPDSNPPPQLADPGILGLSVEVLERYHQLNTDPAASGIRWLSQTYVQWHALAVTIAELCVKKEGPMVERAWAIVIPTFEQASQHVADSHEGMLWRPIKKLMNRAQGIRQDTLSTRSAKPDVSVGTVDWDSYHHANDRTNSGDAMLDITQDVPKTVSGVAPSTDGHQFGPSNSGSGPFDWDSWLAATSTTMEESMQNQYNDDMNQMALINWENFVLGFQAQDEVVTSGPNDEALEPSSLWP